jgi:hypothetical protein
MMIIKNIGSKCLLTFCALLFGVVVPYLEINATHVFNPTWPAHARLHEVWQLATNSMFALYCIWLLWVRANVRTPAWLTIFVTGGFLIAYAIRDVYGGSMLHTDGTERLILGMNIGVFGFGIAILIAILVLLIDVKAGR